MRGLGGTGTCTGTESEAREDCPGTSSYHDREQPRYIPPPTQKRLSIADVVLTTGNPLLTSSHFLRQTHRVRGTRSLLELG